jgi:UPF0716 protein FxsA
MPRLLLLFIVVPAVELVLLIQVGKVIGPLATVGLIIATGVLGAALARRQGLSVLARTRTELAAGRLPADSIGDGLVILLAGALLITPGILTDIFGFLCLIPFTRRLIKAFVWQRLERAVRQGRIHVSTDFNTRRASWEGVGKRPGEIPEERSVRDVPFEVKPRDPEKND